MDKTSLEHASKEYERLYGGAEYYDLAMEIVDSYPVQGSIILLATWNTGRFRYLMSNNAKNLADLMSFFLCMNKLICRLLFFLVLI